MSSKKRGILLLILLLSLVFIINYSFVDSKIEKFFNEDKYGVVERVIDGDTLVINSTSFRLLGINSPEKKEKYYLGAKEFLERLTLNKTVKIKSYEKDKYGRILAYFFIEGKNVNLELVKQGLANFYFPSGKDQYYKQFKETWENCEVNLCEESKEVCSSCIILDEFDYKHQRIVFENKCSFDCNLNNWEIKDEGRKKFIFRNFILKGLSKVEILVGQGINSEKKLFWQGENYVWTSSGDTLFLRDSKNGLVFWQSY